jgi:ParB-like chromosome segregation protein Spo0J
MPKPNPALLPRPALFDVTIADSAVDRRIERIPLEQIELALNARREISKEGIERLAAMLCRTGQLIPCIGHRPNDDGQVLVYDGQRRYLAAKASHELAGSEGFEALHPVRTLIVLLLDHEPSADEIRRIQAQANQREQLSLVDQQEQYRDCWRARAGLREEDRIAAVCADLGISPRRAHNLRRQLALPDEIRTRVAERPAGEDLSVTMANRLADMHDVAPQLTEAVAKRISTSDLHEKALQDLGAFVHRTVVEDEHTYAVRIDDGALLDAHEQTERARAQLTPEGQDQVAGILGCQVDKLGKELDTLAARAKAGAVKVPITADVRDRARAGRYAYVHDRGRDFAASVWVVDPVFIIDLVAEHLKDDNVATAREEAFFKGANLNDEDLRGAADEDHKRTQAWRQRRADATRTNLGLGRDIRAGLMDPQERQLQALKEIVCHLITHHYREVIAYGAGWTDPERQQPVGDTSRREPSHIDAIVEAELERALRDRNPLHGIAQLVARWAAAFVLDADGITRTKALGTERMSRKLNDALPGGHNPLRSAVWDFLRPMLSPTLVELNRDGFVHGDNLASTVDLTVHCAPSDLAELDLGES